MKYDKPFKTYDEQIELLQDRGIIVEHNQKTIEKLSSISYYSLINGYKSTFLQSPNADIFVAGTTFDMIYNLYLLDMNIASIVLKYTLLVERSLKTKIAYRIAKQYGVHHKDFLNPVNYSIRSKQKGEEVLSYIENKCTTTYKNTTSYYYAHNKNHVPPWIVMNDITFNKTIEWYRLLKPTDKDYICQYMIPFDNSIISIDFKKEFLIKSLSILLEYRNSIAHGNKVFSPKIKSILPKRPLFNILSTDSEDILSNKEYNSGFAQKDLYAVFISIIILIQNPDLITYFCAELSLWLNQYKKKMILPKENYTSILGLPDNIENRLLRLSDLKFTHNTIMLE